MKNIIVLIALIAGITEIAFATSLAQPNVFVSRFNEMDINHSFLPTERGSVTVDKDNYEISINLSEALDCEVGMFCTPAWVENVTLKITDIYTDGCGATHYVAQQDKTFADGLLETIEVVDYMTMQCEIYIPHPTHVTYSSFNPWTQKTTVSTFQGTVLEQIIFFSIPDPMLPQIPTPVFK